MTCDVCIDLMSRFLDEDLTPPEVLAMDEHLSHCADCQTIYRDLRETRDHMNSLPDPAMPADAHDGAMARIRTIASQKRRNRMLSWCGAAAAVLVVCAVSLPSLLRISPSAAPQEAKYYSEMAAAAGEVPMATSVPMASSAPAPAIAYDDAMRNATDATMFGLESGETYDYGGSVANVSLPMPTTEPQTGGTLHGLKIERSYHVSVDSWTFDSDMARLTAQLEQVGGYFEYRDISGLPLDQPDGYGRYGSMNMRVPVEFLEAFVGDLQTLGRVTQFNEYANDITNQYYDTQTRLEGYQAELKKLEELLQRAESVEDILSIHNAMTNLHYQIDSLTGSIKSMDGRVSFASVNLSMREVSAPDTFRTSKPSLGERIKTGFIDAVNGLLAFLASALVAVIANAPIWILIAAIIMAAWLIVRRIIKKRREST